MTTTITTADHAPMPVVIGANVSRFWAGGAYGRSFGRASNPIWAPTLISIDTVRAA